MSDIQKLKELMAKYHSVTKKKGYDDGGVVTSDDLAPYMPSAQEEANSGLPPGPQRASYIANKKYQAAHPVPSGYANGGSVSLPWSQQDKEAFSAGARGEAAPSKSQVKTSKYQMGDAEDSTEKPVGQDSSYSKMFTNTPKDPDEVQGLDDGGLVDDVLSGKNSSSENDDPIEQALTAPSDDSDEDDDKDEVTIKAPKSEVKKDDDSDDEDELTLPSQKDAKLLDNTNPSPDNSDASIKDLLNSVANSGAQGGQDNSGGNRPLTLQDLKDAQANDKLRGGIAGFLFGNDAQKLYNEHGQVSQLQQQQQLQSQNTQQQSAQMQNQLTQYKLAGEKEKSDANSPASLFAQSAVAGTYKQLGMNPPPGLNKLSASTIESTPVLDRMLTAQSTNLTKQLIAQQRAAAMQGNQSNKQDDKQNKALTSAQTLLESARGNPAAAQAEKDLYSAQKANSLATLYGDPNKLSLPQVKLLASEVGKIAAGGSSTQSELEGITPNTLMGKMSQYTSNLINAPSPANAAAFVKQYQDYTGALSKDAQKVIEDKYGRVIESRKNQLGPENYQALQDQYINRFKSPSRAPQSTQSSSPIRMQAPDGSIRLIPADQKDAALKAGGKLL